MRWLTALVVCIAAVVVCVNFVDKPLAEFFDALSWTHAFGIRARTSHYALGVGALMIAVAGAWALAGKPLPRWMQAAMLSGFSLAVAVSLTELVLKPFFARAKPAAWFHRHLYGFFTVPRECAFHAFPSGHAAFVAAITSVLWLTYPRWRTAWAAATAAICAAMVLMNWHFLSDVIAGAFIGVTSGIVTVRLWRNTASGNGR